MKVKIKGLALVFDELQNFGEWQEINDPKCLDEKTDWTNSFLYYKHNDQNVPMAHFESDEDADNTLEYNITSEGLEFTAILDTDNPQSQAVISGIERGDIKGCSYCGYVDREDMVIIDDVITSIVQHIARIPEISITPTPAYPQTWVRIEEYIEEVEEERNKEETEENKGNVDSKQ